MSWAEILQCGDAPLDPLDDYVVLKQLEKAQKVSDSETSNLSVALSTSLYS